MKYWFLIFIFYSSYSSFCQEAVVNIEFSDKNRLEIIKDIEQKTNYKFFYLEDWFNPDNRLTGNYNNISIEKLLEEVFASTVINYFIIRDQQKIILTSNNLIRDSLPIGFFKKNNEFSPQNNHVDDYVIMTDKNNYRKKSNETKVQRIGKEKKKSGRSTFSLTGYVKNIANDNPLSNIVLIVKDKNINTVTDINGYYNLKLPQGVNIIETKALGIESYSKKVIIYNDGKLDFFLKESSELLDEVLVNADRDKNVKEAIVGVAKIDVKEIKNIPLVLGERDIFKVAITIPGIKTAGEGASGFSVRGGKEDQNLILLDNAVIYNPTHFFGIFSGINPFTTGNVQIYKGNIPAEFGGRLSSVFDISTKTGNKNKFSGEASIGPVTSNLALEVPIVKDTSSLLIGGRATYSDWVLKSLDNESLKNSEASFYDFIGKYSHQLNSKNLIEATGYYSKDKFSITSDSLYHYSNRLVSLKWNRKLGNKNNLNVIVTNSKYNFNIDYEGNSNRNFLLDYSINESQLKIKLNNNSIKNHKLNYGLSSKYYAINPGEISPLDNNSIITPIEISQERALESSLFIADNFDVNKKLSFNLGLRYTLYALLGSSTQRIYQSNQPKNEATLIEEKTFDKNEIVNTYNGLETRVSGRYYLGEDFSIKGGFNKTIQYIHSLSNNTTVSPTDTWRLSDINIKPQNANQFLLGLYKNINTNKNNYELSLEGYYKTMNNMLDYKVGANLLLNEKIETEIFQGKGKAYGVELFIRKKSGKLNGWLAYTYSRSFLKSDSQFPEERVNNGDFFPANFDKPHDLNIVSNYKLTKRFSLSANFSYQTGRPITYPIGKFVFNGAEQVLYSDRNKFRIPDYYRLDIGFNIEGNHKIKKFAHSFWNISIYNVLGRNNPYSTFFVTNNGEVKAYQSSIFSIPVPTITYNFKF